MNDPYLFNLYQPVSKVNPQDAVSKVKYWSEKIHELLVDLRQAKFTVSSISDQFMTNGRTPACIDYVISELEKSGTVLPLSSYLAGPIWSISGLIHSMSSLFIVEGKETEFVHVDVIKEMERVIMHFVDEKERKLYFCEELAREIPFDVDQELLSVVLTNMSKSGLCSVDTSQACFVKFRDHPDTSVSPIDQSDYSVVSCVSLCNKLTLESKKLAESLEILTAQIIQRGHVEGKLKSLRMMRRRKRMMARMDWIYGVIENLETIVAHHDQQELDRALLGVFRLSNVSRGVDVEELTVIMDECRDLLESVETVDWSVNVADVEEEYNELMREEVLMPSVEDLPVPTCDLEKERVAQME